MSFQIKVAKPSERLQQVLSLIKEEICDLLGSDAQSLARADRLMGLAQSVQMELVCTVDDVIDGCAGGGRMRVRAFGQGHGPNPQFRGGEMFPYAGDEDKAGADMRREWELSHIAAQEARRRRDDAEARLAMTREISELIGCASISAEMHEALQPRLNHLIAEMTSVAVECAGSEEEEE